MKAGNELPYWPVVVDEARARAGDLSNEELGALHRIELALWDANGFLDEAKLIRVSRAGKRWGSIAPAILEHLTVAEGKVSSGRVLIALEAVRTRRAKRAEQAADAARARWELERVRNSGKPVSDLSARLISGTLLKSSNSLKNQNPTMLGASASQCSEDANQNQIDFDNRNYSTSSGAAAGSSDGRSGPNETRVTAEQHHLLFNHGVTLLSARIGLRKLSAHARIVGWLRRCGSADRLIVLLGMAEEEGELREDDFIAFVEEQVCEFERGPNAPEDLSTPIVENASAGAAGNPQDGGQSTDDSQVAAELWLKTTARRTLIEEHKKHPGDVDTQLARWLREVDGDHTALRAVLLSAFARTEDAARRYALIEEGILLFWDRKSGARLPLLRPVAGDGPQTAKSKSPGDVREVGPDELDQAIERLGEARKAGGGQHG